MAAAAPTRGRGGQPGGQQRSTSSHHGQGGSQGGQKRATRWATNSTAVETNGSATPSTSSPQPSPRPLQLDEQQVRQMHDRMLFLVLSLIGSRVVATVKAGNRYEGILSNASTDGEISIGLKFARNLDEPTLPTKRLLLILGKDLVEVHAVNIDLEQRIAAATNTPAARDTFRTDAEISGLSAGSDGRKLQSWADDTDGMTFGLEETAKGGKGKAWDQFATHDAMFGTKSNYHEDLYTTKLDRSGADYKQREREANRLAQEILSGGSHNPHVLEERNAAVQNQLDEEARYGAVQRGPNAYVPPGARARKPNGDAPPAVAAPQPVAPASTAATNGKPAPSPSTTPAPGVRQPSQILAPAAEPVPTQAEAGASTNQLMPDFANFVKSEKDRLTLKRQAQLKKEKDSKLADLLKFSQSFKYNAPIPADLMNVLSKDPEKQKQIQERAVSSSASLKVGDAKAGTSASASVSPNAQQPTLPGAGSKAPRFAAENKPSSITRDSIAVIPPFNPNKARSPIPAASPAPSSTTAAPVTTAPRMAPGSSSTSTTPAIAAALASTSPPPKLKPTAMAFVPGMTSSTTSSPARKPIELPHPPVPANPFFGAKQIKRGSSSMHVKEDFTPFRMTQNVPIASSVPDTWGYQGKSTKDLVATALSAPRPEEEPAPQAPPPSATPVPQVQAIPPQPMPQQAYPVFRGFQPQHHFQYPQGAFPVQPNGMPYPGGQFIQVPYSQAGGPPQVYSPQQLRPQHGYMPGMPVYPGQVPSPFPPGTPMYFAAPGGQYPPNGVPMPQPQQMQQQQPPPSAKGASPHSQPYRRLSSSSSIGGQGAPQAMTPMGPPPPQMYAPPPPGVGGPPPPHPQ